MACAVRSGIHDTTMLLSFLAVSLASSPVMNSDKVMALAMAMVWNKWVESSQTRPFIPGTTSNLKPLFFKASKTGQLASNNLQAHVAPVHECRWPWLHTTVTSGCACSLPAEAEVASEHEGIGGIPQGAQPLAPSPTVYALELRLNICACFTHTRVHQITNLEQVI